MIVPKTVYVGLSGGVDSSVAALLLKQQGYHVVGVFIKVWHPDWLVCNWEQERLDAMRVAAKLDIPFLTCDGVAAYRDAVASEFIAGYTRGETPNPDVLCNKQVKFGVFLDFALQNGADYVATGHYARKISEHGLGRGVDVDKDQSYFLWMLNEKQLSKSLFPIGDYTKSAVRALAADAKLLTAHKKDSQGVCFLGHIDIPEFLAHYIDLNDGVVLSTSGAVIGRHQGAFVYTIGQRHGFTVHGAQVPHYVVSRNIERNTITVSTRPPVTNAGDTIVLRNIVWRGLDTLVVGREVMVETRYRQIPQPYIVTNIDTDHLTLEALGTAEPATIGQSCVLYDHTTCLGGGIITR
jgi:tRNA-uridine 2-sulfurtransferase